MVTKNTSNFGATMTSLGDGSDASFWRQGGVWSSGTPSSSGISVGTSYVALKSTPNYTGPNTAPAGFLTYLIMFSFGGTGNFPSANTQVFAEIALDSGLTNVITAYQVGYTTTQQAPFFSGAYIYNAPDTSPFTLYLASKLGSGTASFAFGSITVIGIN